MTFLPFDSGQIFLPWAVKEANDAVKDNARQVLGDMVFVTQIAPPGLNGDNRIQALDILDYFGIKHKNIVNEHVNNQITLIREQVFNEMLALTGEEYHLDWSRFDKSFCLWYRDRNINLDATREISFILNNTLQIIDKGNIKNSKIHGFGLFASEDINANTTIGILDGQIISNDRYEKLRMSLSYGLGRYRKYFFMEWNALDDELLLARPFRTSYSYINHSTKPNLELIKSENGFNLKVVTLRSISKDEELLLDYRKEHLPRGYFDKPSSSYIIPVD